LVGVPPERRVVSFSPNWPTFLFTAKDARDRTVEILAGDPNRVPGEALVAITMSAFATEAFINELGVVARLAGRGREGFKSKALEQLSALADALEAAESENADVQTKYHRAREVLVGVPFPKGQAPYQGFRDLFELRDALVHPRHRDVVDDDGFVVPDLPVIRDLQQRGLTRAPKPKPGDAPGGMSWVMQIQTGGVAAWAFEAAREIIIEVGSMIPSDGMLTIGVDFFKERAVSFPS
jgi:hypothetical protein